MADLLVRDVPDDVRATLSAKAEAEGCSLDQLLRRELRQIAARAAATSVLDRAASTASADFSFDDALRETDAGRQGE
jgi:plasmid stability protein